MNSSEVDERQAFKDTEGYGYSLEFRKKIISLSESDDFKSACDEWSLDHIEKNDDSDYCICGKEIYNFCYIRNMLNMNQTIIGTDCLATMSKAQAKQAIILFDKQKNPHLYCDLCGEKKKKVRNQQIWNCKICDVHLQTEKYEGYTYRYVLENAIQYCINIYFKIERNNHSYYNHELELFVKWLKDTKKFIDYLTDYKKIRRILKPFMIKLEEKDIEINPHKYCDLCDYKKKIEDKLRNKWYCKKCDVNLLNGQYKGKTYRDVLDNHSHYCYKIYNKKNYYEYKEKRPYKRLNYDQHKEFRNWIMNNKHLEYIKDYKMRKRKLEPFVINLRKRKEQNISKNHKLTFGKHKNKTLSYIYKIDEWYFNWLYESLNRINGLKEEDKQNIQLFKRYIINN